ncbi:MAG: zf-HC2 domain-containing protein [Oscillospiraceae bacterium]|jgi:hypothetical protein|nr:zf-HC2 domain-containing protein [Oscillospiraceae bacterium]
MKTCKDYSELISLAVDGEISAEEKAELDRHLEECEACRSTYDAFLFIHESSDLLLLTPPETLAGDIMSGIGGERGRGRGKRLLPALAALAGCAALFVFVLLNPMFKGAGSAAPMTAGTGSLRSATASDSASMPMPEIQAPDGESEYYGFSQKTLLDTPEEEPDAASIEGGGYFSGEAEDGSGYAVYYTSDSGERTHVVDIGQDADFVSVNDSIYFISDGRLKMTDKNGEELKSLGEENTGYSFAALTGAYESNIKCTALDKDSNTVSLSVDLGLNEVVEDEAGE